MANCEAESHSISFDHHDDGAGVLDEPLLLGHGNQRDVWHAKGFLDRQQETLTDISGGGATFLRTCLNGLNAMSGVGILSIPYAVSEGGWLSLFFLFVLAVICWYTGLLLQKCISSNPSTKTYPDIGELAFGYVGRLFISVFMYLELYLVAIGFLILEGDNLDNLFPGTRLELGMLRIAGKKLFVVIIALVILPTTWLRSMGVLAYISAGGVLASVIVICSVFWAGAFDGVGFHERGRLLNVRGLPTALGLYAFCYCGHAVFPTLHNSMKDKAKFSKVLLVSFVLCSINYGSMAIFGYLMYGESLKSQVTLNLPITKISSRIAIYTTLINPLTKYALMISPVATAIEESLVAYNTVSVTLVVRTLLVFGSTVIALAIPFFGDLMAFIGSLLSIIVSILLPCVCYLKIFKPSGIKSVELVAILLIIIVGLAVAIMGTYSSLQQIFQKL